MSRHTIKFTLYTTRPVTEEDIAKAEAERTEWLAKHPTAHYEMPTLGEELDFEEEHELPACWEICDRCKGEGTHTNPNIDGHGITMEEWHGPDWDDESREMYMSGGYDVACEAGCSDGKVLVPDEEACKSEPRKTILERYYEQQEDEARTRAEYRRTLYMESGGAMGGWGRGDY